MRLPGRAYSAVTVCWVEPMCRLQRSPERMAGLLRITISYSSAGLGEGIAPMAKVAAVHAAGGVQSVICGILILFLN